MEVKIETRPALRVAFVREFGPFMESANKAWERLAAWLEGADVLEAGSIFLGAMHDDPENTAPEKLRYDACVTLPEGFVFEGAPEKGVEVQVVAGGDFAVARHKGPYEGLGETWGRLYGEWMPTSGREPDMRACYEIYVNDPRTTTPEELLTDIYMPLRPKD